MSNPLNVLPPSWVERLFAKFANAYGAAKLASMWPDDDHDAVKQMWGEQLGRFEPETLRRALQATIDTDREWPPTLPEFLASCRRCALERRAHAPAAMLPRPDSNPEVAQEAIAVAAKTISAMKPGREWARRLLNRHAAGEKLSHMQLTMARAALAETADA